LAICDLEFEIWDFSHLAVLGELGGLFFQDQENKAENGHWSLVKRLRLRKGDRRQFRRNWFGYL